MMIRCICHIIIVVILLSCNRNKYSVNGEYVYNSNGFSEGMALSLLKVDSYDSSGMPVDYRDSIRIDLYQSTGGTKKRIYFFKKNEGYYWKEFSSGNKSEILPIHFEKGNWYDVWARNFESGLFKTGKHSFFLYCDSLGKINVYEKIIQTNL